MAQKSIKIFIVDDDNFYLESLAHHLNSELKFPKHILKFSSGEDCLNFSKIAPDFIILDYYLDPKRESRNGIAILKKLKSQPHPATVIVLSAQDHLDVALNTVSHGAYDYVVKNESSFLRITNIIHNLTKRDELHDKLKKQIRIYKTINIIVVALLIALFILSRINTVSGSI